MESRIINYFLVGVVAFIAYYISLFCFYSYFTISYPISIGAALFFSTSIHFFLNKIITFGSPKLNFSELFKYILVVFINYCFQCIVVHILFELLGFRFYPSTIVAVFVSSVVGFFSLKFFVFKKTI
jgi:putative flippase GtrA